MAVSHLQLKSDGRIVDFSVLSACLRIVGGVAREVANIRGQEATR